MSPLFRCLLHHLPHEGFAHPADTFVQPVIGFQVACVHSIAVLNPIGGTPSRDVHSLPNTNRSYRGRAKCESPLREAASRIDRPFDPSEVRPASCPIEFLGELLQVGPSLPESLGELAETLRTRRAAARRPRAKRIVAHPNLIGELPHRRGAAGGGGVEGGGAWGVDTGRDH